MIVEFVFLISGLLCLIRAVIGPTFADRLLALDAFGNIIVLLMVSYAIYIQSGIYLDIALLLALLSFTGVLSVAKWVKK